MEIPLPCNETDVIDAYTNIIDQHPEIKLAIIDHITSMSAILMPVKKLAAVCREKGILVFVDGAHAPGHVPLDLENMDVDFYVGKISSTNLWYGPATGDIHIQLFGDLGRVHI